MSTLILRLAAPLQSWGASSKFNRRATNREPTKSGVIGMIAAALGRSRDDAIDDLRELSFAVRVDQIGKMVKDFHTAHTVDGKQAFISDRYYLSDALFLVAVEGEDAQIERIKNALGHPVFPIFLGRRACPPAFPLLYGISDKPLLDALREVPWQAAEWYKKKQPSIVYLEIVRDAGIDEIGSYDVRDLPITFGQNYRQYAFRSVISDMGNGSVKVTNDFARTQGSAIVDTEAEDVPVES